MAKITRSSIINNSQDTLGLSMPDGLMPTKLNDSVQPTFDIGNRISNICRSGSTTASAATVTLYTTPSNKDFFLTSLMCSVAKTAACDHTTGTIRATVVINGATLNLVSISTTTLTADCQTAWISLSYPLKLDRGSAIIINSTTFTAGEMSKSGSVTGFIME